MNPILIHLLAIAIKLTLLLQENNSHNQTIQ